MKGYPPQPIKTKQEYKTENTPHSFRYTNKDLMFEPLVHSYARWLLQKKGIKIFQGDKQILKEIDINKTNSIALKKKNPYPSFFESEQTNPILKTGVFKAESEPIKIKNYDELLSKGWCLLRRKVREGFVSNTGFGSREKYGISFKA